MRKIHTLKTIEEYSNYLRLVEDYFHPEISVCMFEHVTQGDFRWKTASLKTLFYQLSFNETFEGDIIKDGQKVDSENTFIGFVSPFHQFMIDAKPKSWHGFSILFSLNFAEFSLWNSQTRRDFPFLFDEQVPAFYFANQNQKHQYKGLFANIYQIFQSDLENKHELLQTQLYAILMRLKDDFPTHQPDEISVNQQKKIVSNFIKLVNKYFTNQHQVQFYADALDITQDQLYYSLKKHWGKSPLQVIQNKRLNEAKLLIQYSDLSISEIAYHLNFQELAHFSRFFKKMTGFSPSEHISQKKLF